MSDVRPDDYVTLAIAWLNSAAERFIEDGWENNPDIGEHDFERICDLMVRMVPRQASREQVEAAYQRFADATVGVARLKVDDE